MKNEQPLVVMLPIEHARKLFVVHTISRKRDFHGPGLSKLSQVSFPRLANHGTYYVRCAESMKKRPVVAVFDRVVGAIVATPPLDTQQISTFVEIPRKELLASRRVGSQHLAFQQRPARRWHGRFNLNCRALLGQQRQAPGKNKDTDQYANSCFHR